MDAKLPRNASQQQVWLRVCILGMILWVSSLVVGDHLPAHTGIPMNLLRLALALVGSTFVTGAGWRTIIGFRRSRYPIVLYGKAALFCLGSEAVLQEIWIVSLLLAPEWISARVVVETNLLVGCTAMLAGVVSWNDPVRE